MTYRTNTQPTTVGTIADITIDVDETWTSTNAASMYFNDADEGDMLSISASSGTPAIATAMVNADGMIVVMGVAAGTAEITVTAMDMGVGGDAMMNRMSAMQKFMVTVEAAAATGPLSVTDSDPTAGTITIMWQEIAGAVEYHAIAYNRGTGEFDIKVGLEGNRA